MALRPAIFRIVDICVLLVLLQMLLANCTTDGDIRLVGSDQRNGRLEIFHNGIWGTVCEDKFGFLNAQVVCRQLGFGFRTTAWYNTIGNGNGTIWLDDLTCIGSEPKINDCNHNGWGNHDCDHTEDIAVSCADGIEGDLHLIGGTTYGRLEIFHHGVWGTVCKDGFSEENALVACRQLQFGINTTNAVAYYTAGNGNGIIWLDDLYCTGTERSLQKCGHSGWGIHNCAHNEDVGIRCLNGSNNTSTLMEGGDIRLVEGLTPYEGRIEIYNNNEWVNVCTSNFGLKESSTVCNQLGYGIEDVTFYKQGNCNASHTIFLDGLICPFVEDRLEKCYHRGWRNNTSSNNQNIGIRCYGNTELGYWSSWSSWGRYNEASGYILRSHRCYYHTHGIKTYCPGSPFEMKACSPGFCEGAHWSTWSVWRSCEGKCFEGGKMRVRWCNSPPPGKIGYSDCPGTNYEIRNCTIDQCKVHNISIMEMLVDR